MNLVHKLLSLALVAFLASCASNSFQVERPATERFGSFDALEIGEIKTKVDVPGVASMIGALADIIVEKIVGYNADIKKADDKASPIFEKITKGVSGAENPLIANCTVTTFEEGSRAKRYFIALGSGKAYTNLTCEFVNAAGEMIAEADFEGELADGLFGGGFSETYKAMVNSIVEYLALNY